MWGEAMLVRAHDRQWRKRPRVLRILERRVRTSPKQRSIIEKSKVKEILNMGQSVSLVDGARMGAGTGDDSQSESFLSPLPPFDKTF